MKKTGNFFAFICCVMVFFIMSCAKEYSFEGGLQANYFIEGSPGNCSPTILSGFYIEGTPSGSGNTLQLTVHITTAGNYTIYTSPTDGISFIASGNFADTGTQVVTLQCTGTPASPGSFDIAIPGIGGCRFTLNVLKKAPAQYTLAGDPGGCSGPVIGGTYAVAGDITSMNTVTLQVIVNTPGDYTITTDTIDGISFSAMGHFNATGAQKVVMQAAGKAQEGGLEYFNVTADASQCSFSVPVQDAEPLATYVLQSGTGVTGLVCTPQSVQGVYAAGVSLNGTNSITIAPYAKFAGNYVISTEKINGMIFSAAGNFPSPGVYSVTLQGRGMPATSGTFTYTPTIIGPSPIGGSSCDVSISVQ
ncbi:MAG: hypothetical protein ACRDE5_04745 [Ginsengibacter sp.]